MNERDLQARLRDAYRIDAERADPGALVERVHSIPATVEPEHWRSWLGLRSRAARRTGLGGTHVRGGDNMHTAARVAAVVAALALGASFLAVQVGGPPDEGPPAAAPAATDVVDEIGATHVTGVSSGNRTIHSATYSMEGAHNAGYGGVYVRDVEWSDPRLPSVMRLGENWDWYCFGESEGVGGVISLVQNVVLEGPEGNWTGTAYGLLEETTPVETYPQTVLMILEGEGAYEGLSAMLRTAYDEPPVFGETADWEGYILEGGLTPIPEAPAPPAAG